MQTRIALLSLCVCFFAATAQAQSDWSVVLNGRAVHLNAAKDWNEANWGLGLEKEFRSSGRWVRMALANGFRDSAEHPSYMAGGGLKRRFRLVSDDLYVDLGVIGFLMTRHDVDGNRPFPGVLPALTVGGKHVALNMTYLPNSVVDGITHANLKDPEMRGIFFLQLKLDAGLFGFRGRRPILADASEP
jgi:hypothetical protein